MNKFPIRLTSSDLEQLMNFLQFSLAHKKDLGYTKKDTDLLILAGLAELLHKLSSANNCYKSTYKMQVNVSHGLAFKAHCFKTKTYPFYDGIDSILINNLIGIVDQKTA